MDTQRRWIGYDTFKLIVTLLLLALLLILYLQRPSVNPPTGTGNVNPVAAGGAAQQPTGVAQLPSATAVSPTSAPTNTTAPTLTPRPTDTAVKPTASPTTPPPAPTATATAAAAAAEPTTAPAKTAVPAPTETPAAVPTATTQAPSASTSADCPLAAPSHLAVGKQALVITNLNLRESAGMDKAIRLVSQPNSKLDVIGGPVCVPYQNGAYLWWQVKTQDGTTGWSAEASLSKSFYFLQPAP